jgi:hypothetical protein
MAKTASGYCEMHEGRGTFAFFYQEWDSDHWDDRLKLLHRMWQNEQSAEQKKRVIADLLIHAHDIAE